MLYKIQSLYYNATNIDMKWDRHAIMILMQVKCNRNISNSPVHACAAVIYKVKIKFLITVVRVENDRVGKLMRVELGRVGNFCFRFSYRLLSFLRQL